ncbi:flagellar biosynthesis protein FlgI [Arcobacter sp. 31_11_sub10_T18]|nr:flagellar biosynthesis protein FlgI [Arcobacter sp. 31_11_sub10_T18]
MRYLFVLFLFITSLYSQIIKDVTNIVGIRTNQLVGYGLVVGLSGSGDKSQFTMQSLKNLLSNALIKTPTTAIKSKNIAAVMVTAELPPFARQGDKITISVSAIGDSKSIDHGQLILTQLKGVDGKIYALAQGRVTATDGNPTTGFISEGASIENELDFSLAHEKELTFSLIKSSAKDAFLIETKINKRFGKKLASAVDTRTIHVKKPDDISTVNFLSIIQNIKIHTDIKKKIIIDRRRETIIAGGNITIGPVTLARDSFTLRIKQTGINDTPGVDIGDDVKIGNNATEVNINNALINSKNEPTVSDLMRAMKIMKLPIEDIIESIEMLKDLNAIDVELEIRG